jgi:predicted nucleotidyltransferase
MEVLQDSLPDEDSDIDIFMVGKVDKEKRERISEIMVSLERMYSIQVEPTSNFIKNIDDPFHQTVLEDHVVIFNENRFIDCLSKMLM